ncbi:MAG: cytochrome C family protein, partial [Hyphomicrobiales bacterium]
MKGFSVWLLAIAGLAMLGVALSSAETGAPAPGYVGMQACSGCHAPAVQEWKSSHHAWALRSAEPANVLGN